MRKEKRLLLKGLYVVIDTQSLGHRKHIEVTRQALRGGVAVIQLRDKTHDRGELLPVALEMKKVCARENVLFIINDYLDLAMAVGADGIHVGQTDLPVSVVRKLAPMDMLVGCSVVNVEQALKAQEDGADYVAPGAIFPTPTKESAAIGLVMLKKIKKAVDVPVVAIGGINIGNIAKVKKAGADSAAVINAVLGAPSVEDAVRELSTLFEGDNG
jgi:thiamine-phosphate pyrophosphorylase